MRRSLFTCASRINPTTTSIPSRAFTTSFAKRSQSASSSSEASNTPNSRWLFDLRKRISKCQSRQGLRSKQAEELASRMSFLDKNWLELSAGREGYLTEPKWRGLDRHSLFWGDMHGHVNNVMYNRWAESGRVNWVTNIAASVEPQYRQDWETLMTPKGVGLILASIRTDYKFPMKYPDEVTVMHKLVNRPDHSSDRLILEAVAYSQRHQRLAAKFIEDIVIYDYTHARKTSLVPHMVEELQKFYDMQQLAKEAAERDITALYSLVEQAES